jgi:hypothetical protein
MAWYPEEQWEMISDSIDKKRTAASAFKQRTHCGKSGGVKFPSDYMSKKELNAMNGECVSYRLNAPLSWTEFKELPDDLKINYIKSLRNKFNVPDYDLAQMFDVSLAKLTLYLKDLKIEFVHDTELWNKEAFLAWRTGASSELVKENDISESKEETKYERAPINWGEFKKLPDDEKVAYIKWVRETFGAPEVNIANMLGVARASFSKVCNLLGCGVGKAAGGNKRNWDSTEFDNWCNGTDVIIAETVSETVEEVIVEPVVCVESVEPVEPETEKSESKSVENEIDIQPEIRIATPCSGTLSFEDNANSILNMLGVILGKNKVKLRVEWEVIDA